MSLPAEQATKYFASLEPGSALPGTATEAYRGVDDLAYALSRVPMLTPRPVKIVAVGAGFGGIALARAVRTGQIPGASLTLYEKNAGIGGTWHENRYPGCACDVPAHSYQFTWAPNPHWTQFYASAAEIKQYFEDCADQHDLRKYIKLSHKVTSAKWIEERQVWQLQVTRTTGADIVISSPGVTDGETSESFIEECDVFVNASGFFNNWKWPAVEASEQVNHSIALEELRQLRRQVATLQKQANNPSPCLNPDSTPSTHNSPLPQTSPTVWTAPDPSPLNEPHHRQAASNYTFNFRLAHTHLDAMGIVNEAGYSAEEPSLAPSDSTTPSADPLWTIPREEALRLASVYDEEIGLLYPFLDMQKITSQISTLYDALETAARCGFGHSALPGPAVLAKENLQIIKMVLASASIIETSGSSLRAQQLCKTVKDVVQVNIWQSVGVRTVEAFTLLAIYEFLSDNDLFAWRLIGIVARWCLELRLNQAPVLNRSFPNANDRKFAIRLFWCIHTLDRRWGFGTGLPFAIQSDDIDSALPEPDDEVPYLKAMVAYSRIGSKVWSLTYSARFGSLPPRKDEVGYMDYLVAQWEESLPPSLRLPDNHDQNISSTATAGTYRLQLLLHLRASHMRILLYQPILHTKPLMLSNLPQARTLVSIAKDTIRRLDHLNRCTAIYQTQQMCFNHFLVTALGVIFLAVSMAPRKFGDSVREEFYMALDLVRGFSACSFVSRRLWGIIRGLREIGGVLGLGRAQEDAINHDPGVDTTVTCGPIDNTGGDIDLALGLDSVPLQLPLSQPEAVSGLQMTQDLSEIFETIEQGRPFPECWSGVDTPRGGISGEVDFSHILADLF